MGTTIVLLSLPCPCACYSSYVKHLLVPNPALVNICRSKRPMREMRFAVAKGLGMKRWLVSVDSQQQENHFLLPFYEKEVQRCTFDSLSLSKKYENVSCHESTKFCTLSSEYEKLVFMCGFSPNFVSCYLQPPAITQAFVGAYYFLLSWWWAANGDDNG
jgi:hypothetical protein